MTWDQFPNHVRLILHDMMESDDLTDVTLMCADQVKFKAHKVILSACSEVFKDIIKSSKSIPIPGSFIYLRGIQSTEMKSLLEFMYLGQATLEQDRMSDFLNIAKDLKIKGIRNCMDDFGFKHEYQNSVHKISTENSEATIDATDLDGTECPECDKVFTQKAMMRQHFRSVHQGIRFPCDICGLQVTTKYKLIAHHKSKHSDTKVTANIILKSNAEASNKTNKAYK